MKHRLQVLIRPMSDRDSRARCTCYTDLRIACPVDQPREYSVVDACHRADELKDRRIQP